jgi:hypothetical protein
MWSPLIKWRAIRVAANGIQDRHQRHGFDYVRRTPSGAPRHRRRGAAAPNSPRAAGRRDGNLNAESKPSELTEASAHRPAGEYRLQHRR